MSLINLMRLSRPLIQNGARSFLKRNETSVFSSSSWTTRLFRSFTSSSLSLQTNNGNNGNNGNTGIGDISKQISPLPYRFDLPDFSNSRAQPELVERESALLTKVKGLLKRLDAPKDDLLLIERTKQQLHELFLLVVLGEFNSGKSSFINALLGGKFLEEGVTPTTSEITKIIYGPSFRTDNTLDDSVQVQIPLPWLQQVNLVDTPGTNAIIESHERITRHFLPRCDFILFLTSCDRPLSSSETRFLEKIGDWKKKILVIVTKTDQSTPEDLSQITSFVKTNIHSLLHITSPVFPISSRQAQTVQKLSRLSDSPKDLLPSWNASGFPSLFEFLHKHLDSTERTRIKLESPLNITQLLLERYSNSVDTRAALIEKDKATLVALAAQNQKYVQDMRNDIPLQLNQVKIVLEAMRLRGIDFIARTFSIWNLVSTLKNPNGFTAAFQAEVLKDYTREIDTSVANIANWVTSNNSRRLKQAISDLGADSSFKVNDILSDFDSEFNMRRVATIERVTTAVRSIVDANEQAKQSHTLLSKIKSSVYQTLAVEAGAVSFAALFAASLLDLTGVGMAAVLATAGFIWLPYKQRQVAQDYESAVKALSFSISTSVATHCDAELGQAITSFDQSVLPFSTFLDSEHIRLTSASEEIDASLAEIQSIRKDVDSVLL